MIRNERPPNYDAIIRVFPMAANGGVIYAYGEDIFNPDGITIPTALLKHEYRHCARQWVLPGKAEEWWTKYLSDPTYRYDEELVAHVEEYYAQVGALRNDRNARARLLMTTAQRLVAPLYQYGTERTVSTALRDLRWIIEKR